MTRTVATLAAIACFGVATPSCSYIGDDALTQIQGTGIGTLAGGAVGAGIGNLFGNDTKSTLIGAGVGALTGAVIGNIWGRSVVKDKQAYRSKEAYVQANIDQLDDRIAQTEKSCKNLDKQIANLKKQNTITKSQLAEYNKAYKENIALIDEDIRNARNAVKDKEVRAEVSSSEIAVLQKRIDTLSAQKSKLQQKNATLKKGLRVA